MTGIGKPVKVSREQLAENRRNILAAAARLFRERGFDAVTLDDVMNEANLTRGGFYGHFKSKSDLMAQACAFAMRPTEHEPQTLLDYCTAYLSKEHRDNRAEGCPVAALGSEAVRQSLETPHKLAEGTKRIIAHLSKSAPGRTASARRIAALASFSAILGGLVLARMVDDPALSDEVLAANRKALTNAAS